MIRRLPETGLRYPIGEPRQATPCPGTTPMNAPVVSLSPFHLAFPVNDLESTRRFYGDLLGCGEGRSSDRWIDFDLFGHQIVAHVVQPDPADLASHRPAGPADRGSNPVDGHDVPIPHFGLVLEWQAWHELKQRLTEAGVVFEIEPCIRFAGEPGEQATMFFRDPSGNALEFKSFRDPQQLFVST